MNNTCGIVLAAGMGKRMCTCKPKVLSEILFKPMLFWVLDSMVESKIKNICVVTGFMHKLVENAMFEANYDCENVFQAEQKGTAHAVLAAKEFLKKNIEKDVFIVGADSPFIGDKIIQEAYKIHKSHGNHATIISSHIDNPSGYGRIVRDHSNNHPKACAIVEENDATEEEKAINEVNSGAYWFNVHKLLDFIGMIKNDTAQHEYYLTSLIELFIKNELRVEAFTTPCAEVVMGANDCMQLANLNEFARKKILKNHISNGVFVPCSDGVIIGKNVKIEDGTTIFPNTIIKGNTVIGHQCTIGPNSVISDCTIGDNVVTRCSYCENATIKSGKTVNFFEKIVGTEDERYSKQRVSV